MRPCLSYRLLIAIPFALASAHVRAADESTQPGKLEVGIVPLVGGDTDIGFGVGQISNVARLASGAVPYRWRVESAAFITFKSKPGAEASVIVPFQDYYVLFVAPQLWRNRLRVELRPSFTSESTLRYYGLGNASVRPATDIPDRDWYSRIHPTLWLRGRVKVAGPLSAEAGSSYTYNILEASEASTLQQQLQGDDLASSLLHYDDRHGVWLSEGVVFIDTRDNEISPERGQFHQAKLRVSPRVGKALPYSYRQVNATARFYVPIVAHRLRLGVRFVGDVLFGDPPFYELARFEETPALGGLNAVRGVPAQRYYGKVKVFSNLELDFSVWRKRVAGKDYRLGLVGFVDAGRVWTEISPHPELDGSGWGLKYGVGSGVRVQAGQTFVVRADLAWSPDARPLGAYLAAGQMF